MYIEVLHDSEGNIVSCYCADTLPESDGAPLFTMDGGVPKGQEQVRINIDILTAMDIEAGSGMKAVIDSATGKPKIVRVDRTEYIMKTFRVDIISKVPVPSDVKIPKGMKVRKLIKK